MGQKQSNTVGADTWPVSRRGKPSWIIPLLLCAGIISSCGAAHSSTTAPPLSPTASAHTFHARVKTFDGDFTITLDISPNRSGTNVFMVQVMDNHNGKLAAHVTVTLYTTMQDMQMGTDSVVLRANGSGQFSSSSDNLSMGGHWAIGIAIQTPDHIIHKAGVSLVTIS